MDLFDGSSSEESDGGGGGACLAVIAVIRRLVVPVAGVTRRLRVGAGVDAAYGARATASGFALVRGDAPADAVLVAAGGAAAAAAAAAQQLW